MKRVVTIIMLQILVSGFVYGPFLDPGYKHSIIVNAGERSLEPAGLVSNFQFVDEGSQPGSPYSADGQPNPWVKTYTKNWMSYLPDSLPLRSVSIPGTHDSGALYGGIAVQTQSWSIANQLEAGIRFLDIRTRRTQNAFAIHHGAFFQKQMFGDVMNAVTAFLAAHPKEVIVMRIKADEHTAESGSQSFDTIWASYLTRYGNYVALNTDPNATLGSLRGKVFVLQDGWSDSTRGIRYNNTIFDTQDLYKVYFLLGDGIDWSNSKAHLPGKTKVVNEYLDRASASTNTKWVRNYLSGSTGMAPDDVARRINNSAYEYIGANARKRVLGTVIMDFPGEQLIYRITKSNFQSQKPCVARTFRSVSDHSWVEFRLPAGVEGQVIEIPGGAYNHYVFPKCNRVWWDNLAFSCTQDGAWQRTRGNWDADGLCHGSPGSSPYVFTGNR